ncbi:Uncharacterised protein [Pragia fontium]|uniref:Uncharacterized protein n=1 Tax=Pragia fontium TaxID=82985 RepID=A0ABQ5LDH6_9GAMM|nr:hypothetical protein [Pragia fontium]GKX61585.1 hypothetical protein SOASR032_01540 [Pragia fontium]SUB82612.1 Uncharacterised protein [Pragia fontium]
MESMDLDILAKKLKSLTVKMPIEVLALWEASEDAWCLKSIDGTIIYVNKSYHDLITPISLKNESSLRPFREIIKDHDNMVRRKGLKVDAVGVLALDDGKELRAFFCERMPFYNRNAKVSGIISHIGTLNAITPNFFI